MIRGYPGATEASGTDAARFAPRSLSGSTSGESTFERSRGHLLDRLRESLGSAASPALLRELDSLRAESDPQFFQESLLDLGVRQEGDGNPQVAALLYQALRDPTLGETPATVGALSAAARAGKRLDALEGRGALGARTEFLLRGFARQAAEPSALLAMGVAGGVFRLTRLAALSRLTANPGFLTRTLGAGRLASWIGFAAEAPAFTLAGRLGAEAMGRGQDWRGTALERDLASSYLVLGGLRLAGWASGASYARITGPTAALRDGPLRTLFSQTGMLGGILLGHGLERWAGLRPAQDSATTLLDSLTMLLQFHVAGRLSGAAFGPRWAAWERNLDLQAAQITSAPLPPVGSELPVSALVAGATHSLPDAAIPASYMMSASGRGRGPRRGRLTPLLGGKVANHNDPEVLAPERVEPPETPAAAGAPRVTIAPDRIQALPRGGVMVRTEAGLLQFGVPMWTNKDAFEIFLRAGGFKLDREEIRTIIPTLYVFDLDYVARHDGLLPADFMQYMYFVNRGQETTLLTHDAGSARRLREFLDLSYQGPREQELSEQVRREYAPGSIGIPDMGAEIRRGFPSPAPDSLRRIAHLDEAGGFEWKSVAVRKRAPMQYEIFEDGSSLGELDLRAFPLPQEAPAAATTSLAREARRRVLRDGHPALWPIGTGHGFTPREETSGFMIWNRGKAVLVDPPSSTLAYLQQNSIPLSALDGILLTHGHTDHYGNAVPMLLGRRPNLKIYSTPTIYRMLQEQYSLALGEGGSHWNFVPLYPQAFANVNGLHLMPDYGFHPVPAIGFEIYDRPNAQKGNLVVAFTGDTFANQVELWNHAQIQGQTPPLLSPSRAARILRHNSLLFASKGQKFPPVFLIEGGVPPIHIPPARTRELLDQAELMGVDTSRVRVYHVAAEAAAEARVPKWVAGAEGFFDLAEYFRKKKGP